MNCTVYNMSIEDMTRDANVVKEGLLAALEREGLLTKPAAEIAEQYTVVFSKPGWLGNLFRKITGQEDKGVLAIDILKKV